jgi:hypothetical protein
MPCKQNRLRVDTNGRAFAGSQRQIQSWVNLNPNSFSAAILGQLNSPPHGASREWVSPLEANHYDEYNDGDFLRALGLGLRISELTAFWPHNGPCWDALAVMTDTEDPMFRGVVIFEAKSHPREARSSCCKAIEGNRKRIESALSATKSWLGVVDGVGWTGDLYQYANRLAHLFFFKKVLGLDAWLVNVYFLNDPHSPTSHDRWIEEIELLKRAAGIPSSIPYVSDLLIEAHPGNF